MPKTIRFGLGLGLAGVQRVLELSVVVARLDVHQRRQLDSRMRFWKTKELGGGGGGAYVLLSAIHPRVTGTRTCLGDVARALVHGCRADAGRRPWASFALCAACLS
jgi:hypothetical protein